MRNLPTSRGILRSTGILALLCALFTSAIWLQSGFAAGRRTVVDFDPTVANPDTGDSWTPTSTDCASPTLPATCNLSPGLGDNGSSAAIGLGFTLQIGTTDYSTIFINENGIATFGTPLDEDSDDDGEKDFAPAVDLAALEAFAAAPFVAPFYTNLIIQEDPTNPSSPFNTGTSSVNYYRGSADPTAPYHPTDASDPLEQRVPAFAVTWREANLDDSSLTIATQIVLYSTNDGTGDFDLRIRYGDEGSALYDGTNTVVGFSLNTGVAADRVAIAAPYGGGDNGGGDLFYSFRNGHLVNTTGDGDADGVPDATDNCPIDANADQANLDGDLFGDVCDPDRDNDGRLNENDNCPAVANGNQLDLDADGQGDVCDADLDGDAVANVVDNCPNVANATQADADGDGLGDACDTPIVRCKVDRDNDVDALDILLILARLRQPAFSPTDPRDADGNGLITLKDADLCTRQCTRRYCRL